jgi:pyruvate-formate lyase
VAVSIEAKELTWQERIDALRATKLAESEEKRQVIGPMDRDDHALILPPPDRRMLVQTISSSGMPITDVLLTGYKPEPNHPSGGFFGPRVVGQNFRRLLETHPPYVDPMASLAGGYFVNFLSYRKVHWHPDFAVPEEVTEAIEKFKIIPGIGATQHFCQDMKIGLDLGWRGILEKIRHYCQVHGPEKADFYDGLEDVVLGIQNWMQRTANEARRMAEAENHPQLSQNLLEMAEMNDWLVTQPPRTFREACQWTIWYLMVAQMYNGSGGLGKVDLLLQPYYERDKAAGILTDEEAVFHLACLLLRGDTAYSQLGGPDADGEDVTNPVSYLLLEAAHRIKIPANIGVSVGKEVDPGLLKRGVEIQFEDKMGIPKFLGCDNVIEGFVKNGIPAEDARRRAYSGCHWYGIPGREYTLNDCVKLNFGPVFDYALREMTADESITPSMKELWRRFEKYLRQAVHAIAVAIDFHLEHMHEVFPELVLDLLSHDVIERGKDASHGGLQYYNMCIDGAALATIADSFAALEQRVEVERRMTWEEMLHYLDIDWAGADGERARLLMHSIPRYGSGGSLADDYALRISRLFTCLVKEQPTPQGHNLIPGLFSWANTIPMGQELGATPNGRHAGAPISHGCNPDPGFRQDGAPTAMAVAVAAVQPGWGNTAPMQMDLDPGISKDEEGVEIVSNLIRTHFDLGGTQINLNIVDAAQILAAHEDPSSYPDLIVRVTGFSAYFASLSPEFRQLVVDRIIAEGN